MVRPMTKEDYKEVYDLWIRISGLGIRSIDDSEAGVHKFLDRNPGFSVVDVEEGKIVGAILQGDLAYGGILQQLIARHIDVTKVKKPIFDVDYSDFFNTKENFEFYFEED